MTQKSCRTCALYREGKCRWNLPRMPFWLDPDNEETDFVRDQNPDDGYDCETWIERR